MYAGLQAIKITQTKTAKKKQNTGQPCKSKRQVITSNSVNRLLRSVFVYTKELRLANA